MELKLPTCPVCGGEAVEARRSIQEVEPQRDNEGNLHPMWVRAGEIIAWCAQHVPTDPLKKGTATYLDGRVISLDDHIKTEKQK